MPLAMTLTSILLAMVSEGPARNIIRNPTLQQFQSATSVHVLAFTSHGQLLVAESEGSFTLEDWNEVFEIGKAFCCDGIEESEGTVMQESGLEEDNESMMKFAKSALREKVSVDLHWKE